MSALKKTGEIGAIGEDAACNFLIKKGFKILKRNFHISSGEIDIIAKDRDELVFIEVKARKSTLYGYPEESVHFFKQKKMARAIRAYLDHGSHTIAFRIDIISVILSSTGSVNEIYHIPNIIFDVEI